MNEDSEKDFMTQFCESRYPGSDRVRMDKDKHGQFMHVEDPVVVAAFVAFCSGNGRRVFLRGSCRDFPESFPSLFRDEDRFCLDAHQRWSAYGFVLKKLRDKLKGTRWDQENLGAILQHYGIKTPWLDVVRDFHTAIWFATHTLDNTTEGASRAVKRSKEKHAWISLYVDRRRRQRQLTVVDLWDAHSSQHVRPHTQQGLSLAVHCDPKNEGNHCPPVASTCNFKTHRVGRIQFPARSKHWRLSGHLFLPQFLFPTRERDDSLDQLLDIAGDILKAACEKHGLAPGTLGAVYAVVAD